MREKHKKLIFTIIIFAVVVSLLTINISANTTGGYNSCDDYYFGNLAGNAVPTNYAGSCAYVATSMLLAYYDVYWNDNFIKDTYEQEVAYTSNLSSLPSATFKSETSYFNTTYWNQYISNGGTMTLKEYIGDIYPTFFQENRDQGYLHIDLIYMGIDAGYYDGLIAKDEYAATVDDMAKILDTYFDSIFGSYRYYDPLNLNNLSGEVPPLEIKTLSSKIPGTSHEDVLDKMYELLNENTPVIYAADVNEGSEEDKKYGHAMIAYNAIKDSSGNIVDCYLHMGSNSAGASRQKLSTTDYTEDISILWLEIDKSRITHVCSNNYVDSNGNTYCSCQVYGDLHPEHVHEKKSIISHDANEHIYRCKWGCVVEESHSFTYMRMLNAPDASSYHYNICECGYSELEAHTFVPTSKPLYLRCSKCGYERSELGGGSNVIMGKKEDEETE